MTAKIQQVDTQQSEDEQGPPFAAVEDVARALCALAGKDWDSKHRKRGHWRSQAIALMRACPLEKGWARAMTLWLEGRR